MAVARKAALRISAQSSSAVEGIRAPFAKGGPPTRSHADDFIAYWKQRITGPSR